MCLLCEVSSSFLSEYIYLIFERNLVNFLGGYFSFQLIWLIFFLVDGLIYIKANIAHFQKSQDQ